MVEIRPKIVPQVQAGKPIGFKASNKTPHSSSLIWTDADNHMTQNELLAATWVMMEQFRTILCEVSIVIGSKDGISKYAGTIEPYDQTSLNAATNFWEEIKTKIDLFSENFPTSSFSMSCTQTVEITPPRV